MVKVVYTGKDIIKELEVFNREVHPGFEAYVKDNAVRKLDKKLWKIDRKAASDA